MEIKRLAATAGNPLRFPGCLRLSEEKVHQVAGAILMYRLACSMAQSALSCDGTGWKSTARINHSGVSLSVNC